MTGSIADQSNRSSLPITKSTAVLIAGLGFFLGTTGVIWWVDQQSFAHPMQGGMILFSTVPPLTAVAGFLLGHGIAWRYEVHDSLGGLIATYVLGVVIATTVVLYISAMYIFARPPERVLLSSEPTYLIAVMSAIIVATLMHGFSCLIHEQESA